MLNFYKIVKENLSFNRFEFRETVCLEYTCPIDAEQIGIFSRNDYLVYVLSGKKTYKTINGEWTLGPGESLYLKKGAEVIHLGNCLVGGCPSKDMYKQELEDKLGITIVEKTHK